MKLREFAAGSSKAPAGAFGGKGKFLLPLDHRAGMAVPTGGANCATCTALRMDDGTPRCAAPEFVTWNGGDDAIPGGDPEHYCSDWYTPKKDEEAP